VAAGVIQHPHRDKIFIAKRLDGTPYEGFWEYPGGKIEPGESARAALDRELREECGIVVEAARPLIRISHDYPDRSVELNVFLVTAFSGEPHGREGQDTAWVARNDLRDVRFLEGNRPITNAAMLDSQLAITNTRVYSRESILSAVSSSGGPGLVQVRDKHLSDDAWLEWAKSVVDASRSSRKRVFLNRGSDDIQCWLKQTGAHGIHLDSASLMSTKKRPVNHDVWLSASCHGLPELRRAAEIDVDFALVSPVQHTSSHPDARPVGWQAFGALCNAVNFPVFALGGVKPADLTTAWEHGAQGVAMISGAWTA